MMRTALLHKILICLIPIICLSTITSGHLALAQQNDIPTGAGQAEITEPGKKVPWWKGLLNRPSDIDWYWFQLEKPTYINIAFEKPSHRDFYCQIYSGSNLSSPLLEVKAGNIGEPFAGYTTIALKPGKYYMKIFGKGRDYSRGEEENYQYALAEPESSKIDPNKEGNQGLPPEDKQPGAPPEEKEMDPEDLKRLLDAMLTEEENQRAEVREKLQEEPEETWKDW